LAICNYNLGYNLVIFLKNWDFFSKFGDRTYPKTIKIHSFEKILILIWQVFAPKKKTLTETSRKLAIIP